MGILMLTLLAMISRSAYRVPVLADYQNRVFVGGNYDDMPPLRKISGYIRNKGFEPILAFDIGSVPKHRIHDVDIECLQVCKYAIFEVSSTNGHLMEIAEAVKNLGTVVFAVYKVRSSRHRNPPDVVSTMLTTLAVPMLKYHDDESLEKIIHMIFPSIRDDPKPTWARIIRASQFPLAFKSWFTSNIDNIWEFL